LGRDHPETAAPLLGPGVQLEFHEDAVKPGDNESAQDGLLTDVLWSSAPQIRERQELTGIPLEALVTAYEDDEAQAAGSILLAKRAICTWWRLT